MRKFGPNAENLKCTGCGACVAVCVRNCLEMRLTVWGTLVPRMIQIESCSRCHNCISVCPCNLDSTLDVGKEQSTSVIACYVGRAVDQATYSGGQSGGIVTALLLSAFSNQTISSALLTRGLLSSEGFIAKSYIARDCEALRAAQGSKYCPGTPVPLIKHLGRDEKERFAIVGLPCQIDGFNKCVEYYPWLKRSPPVRIGLICDRIQSTIAAKILVEKAGQHNQKVNLRFRDKAKTGYPGQVSIESESGDLRILSAKERIMLKEFCTPFACKLCGRKENPDADLVVGDPHGLSRADPHGESVVIVRTKTGGEFINGAVADRYVFLKKCRYQDIESGQNFYGARKSSEEYRAVYKSNWSGEGSPSSAFRRKRKELQKAMWIAGSKTELVAYRRTKVLILIAKIAAVKRSVVRKTIGFLNKGLSGESSG